MSEIKILVAAHKEYYMPVDKVYIPILVGAAINDELSYNMRDDCGENISSKNPYYCELTALYWAWKHMEELHADYIGLAHYRRYFAGAKYKQGIRSISGHGRLCDSWETIASSEDFEEYLDGAEIILPQRRNYYIESNYSQYAHAHNSYVLEVLRHIIGEKYPEYLYDYDARMRKSWGHRFNMMIMSRTKLDEYCTWLFGILFELENRLKRSETYEIEQRVFGFISERLIDVWLDKTGYTYREVPYVNIEGENKLSKGALMICRKVKAVAGKHRHKRGETISDAATYRERKVDSIKREVFVKARRNIAAVVVTYNRCSMLKENIAALMEQTERCMMDIIVIDNASEDGTEEMLKSLIPDGQIIYINTGSNLGGAGGFNYGMKWAAENGYEFCWVMDDDCIPEADALETFISYERGHCGEYGFLSSKILWKDGTLCSMNIQRETMYRPVKNWDRKIVPVVMASFVSLWVPVARLYELGLPISEFFIWTDDWEFTRRISMKFPSYLLTDSICVHKCAHNTGADIVSSNDDRIERFRYLYRNDVVLYRREGLKGVGYEVVRLSGHVVKVALKSKDNKFKRIGIILSATRDGVKFNPEIEFPDKPESNRVILNGE